MSIEPERSQESDSMIVPCGSLVHGSGSVHCSFGLAHT